MGAVFLIQLVVTLIWDLLLKKNAFLNIGNNWGISNTTIVCWKKIVIEDNVMIASHVSIMSLTHDYKSDNMRMSPIY